MKPFPGDAIAINSLAAISTAFGTKLELYTHKLENNKNESIYITHNKREGWNEKRK